MNHPPAAPPPPEQLLMQIATGKWVSKALAVVDGSFLETVPAGADASVMKHIKCRRALAAGSASGKALIVDQTESPMAIVEAVAQ